MKKNETFWSLVKKEFLFYVNSPLAYVVIVPFLLISTFMFFRTALVLGDANLRPFVELLPWFLVVIGPALAMRAFSDEFRKGTIELLFAHPLSEWQIVLSKFVGLMLFYGLMLLSTVSLPITILVFANPDIGLLIGQYLGAFFVGGVFLAIGLAASAFINSSVGAFLLGAALNFVVMLVGLNFIVLAVPAPLNRVLIEFGVASHLTNISRGVLDLRDLLYFGSMAAVALSAAVMKLSERKLSENDTEKRKLWMIMALILGIGIVGNILMLELPLRFDMTVSRRYSLSKGTVQMLKELPDKVAVTLYALSNLPGPMQVVMRDTTDRLKDFDRYSDRLVVETKIVGVDQASKSEAMQAGMREVQFNQMSAGSYQVQTGFLGLALRFGEKTEMLSFIEDAADLEYELSRLILKMTRDELPKLGVIEAHSRTDTVLSQYLTQQYNLVPITDEGSEEDMADLAAVLVVDDGSSEQATAAAKVRNFMANGGNVMALVDGVNVNQAVLVGNPSSSDMINLFEDFGVRVNKDLVYDVQLNEPISIGQGNMQYIVSYPFWVRSLVDQKSVPWGGSVNNVLVGWPSSVQMPESGNESVSVDAILVTSQNSGAMTSNFIIQPAQLDGALAPDEEVRTLGALIQKEGAANSGAGDSDIVADNFISNVVENQAFVSNMIDWVAADEILALIPKRSSERTVFTFASTAMVPVVQYGNIIIPPVLAGGFGIWWLRRRRKQSLRRYEAKK